MGNSEELLKKLTEDSKKSLKLQKIRTACVFAMLVMMAFSVFVIVPRVVNILDRIQNTVATAEEAMTRAQETLDGIDEMADSLTKTGDDMNALINENGEKIADSLEKMSNIDFDGLNQGIKDLQDAVGPFANFMKKFK